MALDPETLPDEEKRLSQELDILLNESDLGERENVLHLLQTCMSLGNVYQLSGRLSDAEQVYEKALFIYSEKVKDSPEVSLLLLLSTIHTEIGVVFRKRANFDLAKVHLEKALEIRNQLASNDPDNFNSALADSYVNLGTVMRKLGDHEEAKTKFKRAIDLRKERAITNQPEDLHMYALALASMGTLMREMGKYVEAKKFLTDALESRKKIAVDDQSTNKIEILSSLANLYNSLGVVCNDLKDFSNAIKYYLESVEIYESLEDEMNTEFIAEIAMVYNNIGSVYRNVGNIEDAERAFVKSYDLYKSLVRKDPHVYSKYLKIAMENLKLFYNQIKSPEKALLLVKDTLAFIQEVAQVVDGKIQDMQEQIETGVKRISKKTTKKVGRNDPCPCGSGKKYKKCCLSKER